MEPTNPADPAGQTAPKKERKSKWDVPSIPAASEDPMEKVKRVAQEIAAQLSSKASVIPSATPVHVREIDINDSRNRIHLTKHTTHSEIQKASGALIIVRGRYRPPGDTSPLTDRPLYLHVSSDKEENVLKAVALIEQYLQQGPTYPAAYTKPETPQHLPHPSPPTPLSHNGQVSEIQAKVYVAIDADYSFNLIGRLTGPENSYIKHIQNEAKVRIQLRGRGAPIIPNQVATDADEALHFFIEGPTLQHINMAKSLCDSLLNSVRTAFKSHRPQVAPGYYPGYYPPYGYAPGQPSPYVHAPPGYQSTYGTPLQPPLPQSSLPPGYVVPPPTAPYGYAPPVVQPSVNRSLNAVPPPPSYFKPTENNDDVSARPEKPLEDDDPSPKITIETPPPLMPRLPSSVKIEDPLSNRTKSSSHTAPSISPLDKVFVEQKRGETVPSTRQLVIPILSKREGSGSPKKSKKSVRFSEENQIRYIEARPTDSLKLVEYGDDDDDDDDDDKDEDEGPSDPNYVNLNIIHNGKRSMSEQSTRQGSFSESKNHSKMENPNDSITLSSHKGKTMGFGLLTYSRNTTQEDEDGDESAPPKKKHAPRPFWAAPDD